jgi:hypothetical protein
MRLSHFSHHEKRIKRPGVCRVLLIGCLLVLLAACSSEPTATSTPVAAPTFAPPTAITGLPTPAPMTLVPPASPTILPTLAVTPTPVPLNLDKWKLYTGPANEFSFRYPPDWGGREYAQAITNTFKPLTVNFVYLYGPGPVSPEFVVMHHWPALDATQLPSNATAWSSVAGLARIFLYSECATTFDAPAPAKISGQDVSGAKFIVQCDRLYAGYLVGIVNNGVNYGLLVDVPAEEWDAWRPTFETMLASFSFGP